MRYAITNTGYLSNSPDRNNDYNIIPSNHITMKGVRFPILAQDDLGNYKVMFPGQDYKFKGSKVKEIPLRQKGGIIEPMTAWYNNDKVKDSYQMANQYDNGWYSKWMSHPESIRRVVANTGMTEEHIKNFYVNPSLEALKKIPVYDESKLPNYSDFNYNAEKQGFKGRMSYSNNYRLPKGVAGRYNSENEDIVIRTKEDVITGTHEISHAADSWDNIGEEQIKSLFPGRLDDKQTFYKNHHVKESSNFIDMYNERYEYLKKDGMYPRIMEIRRGLNLKPGQNVSKDLLKKANKINGYLDLKSFYNDDEIIRILNTVSDNNTEVLPIVKKGGEMKKCYKCGGEIKKYQNAGEYIGELTPGMMFDPFQNQDMFGFGFQENYKPNPVKIDYPFNLNQQRINQLRYPQVERMMTNSSQMVDPLSKDDPFLYNGRDLLNRPLPQSNIKLPDQIQGVSNNKQQSVIDRGWGMRRAMLGMLGLGIARDLTDKSRSMYDYQMRQQGNSLNQYNPNNNIADYGDYTLNAGIGSNFRPKYKDGGEYDLSQEEIDELIKQGYDVEFL